MARVLTAAVFVPSPPLLVPELNGLAANETDELRSAALAAVSEIGDCTEWVVVGTGRDVERIAATATGTFRGYGTDVRVGLGPDATGDADPDLALPALIAGWLRGRAAPGVRAEVHVVPADAGRDECTRLGQRLRTELDEDDTRRGLLVIADGAATLTAKAPGAFDARAEAVETDLAAALGHDSPAVRYWGAIGLGNLGQTAAPQSPALTKALKDDSASVRIAAFTTRFCGVSLLSSSNLHCARPWRSSMRM